MKAGEMIEFQGRTYPKLYTPKNQTIIEIFQITPMEERKMRTIISQAEKNRRLTEKRRTDGVKAQPGYSTSRPWEIYGIGRRTYFKYKPDNT